MLLTLIATVVSTWAGGKEPAAGILSPTNPSKTQMMMEMIHCDSVMKSGASSCKEMQEHTMKNYVLIT